MLWLIWIALMLLTPVMAGVHVWWQLCHEPTEAVVTINAGHVEPTPSSDAQ